MSRSLDEVAKGATDEEMVRWLDAHGRPKTEAEKEQWNNEVSKSTLYTTPRSVIFLFKKHASSNSHPETTTLFDWVEADDRASHPQVGA